MKYEWERFLCPRGETVSLVDGGYLYVPEGKYASYFRSEKLYRLSDLATPHCVVLLGEPGIGKSTILEELHCNCEKSVANSEDTCAPLVRLSAYDSADRLIRDVFESPDLLKWASNSSKYYM